MSDMHNNTDEMRFKTFKRHMLKAGNVALIIGKKGSGKSTVLMDLCHSCRGYPEVILFQKTYKTNPMFHDVVPPLFCYSTWDHRRVQDIMDRQEKRTAKLLAEDKDPVELLIIVDDFACDPAFVRDKLLNTLVMNARHMHITMLITLQDALVLGPALRANADWIFAMRELNTNSQSRLRKHFFGHFDQELFIHVFMQMTARRGVMVLQNTDVQGDTAASAYFKWTATPRDFHDPKFKDLKKWKMGSKSYWAFNYRHIKTKEDDENDGADSSDLVIIKNKRR